MQDGLLAAIDEYKDSLSEEENFTQEITTTLNLNEPFTELQNSKLEATFQTPMTQPIYLRSVKVIKY